VLKNSSPRPERRSPLDFVKDMNNFEEKKKKKIEDKREK
jgi:hypothetical protein